MNTKYKIIDYFKDVETTKEHKGYTFSIGRMLTVVILGSMCGLRNISDIHQWASNKRIKNFLWKYFEIMNIPCYYWFLSLLKLIKPESLNQCFINWTQYLVNNGIRGKTKTVSFDGKTIRSTGKMKKYESALHIVSAQLGELGITIGQKAVEGKSNEIAAVQELIKLLDINDCIVVADALNCQRLTAKMIIEGGGDYLLDVKDNQKTLKEDIEDYVQDAKLRESMDKTTSIEKNGGRIERRTAYSTNDIEWIEEKDEWKSLSSIGAINTQFTVNNVTTNEWHYYISSRALTAEELLKHARLEWTVESMHWLLDVHYGEDFCRIGDRNIQQNLNIARKIALNNIRNYKNKTKSKKAFSKISLDCFLECKEILSILCI